MDQKELEEKIYEEAQDFEANYIYRRLKKGELNGLKISDDEIALTILAILTNQLPTIKYGSMVTLINILKLTMANNLNYQTRNTIFENVNYMLQNNCSNDIYLLLDNLKSYINCFYNTNSNEQQLRAFYEEELEKSSRKINNLSKTLAKREIRLKELEKANKSLNKKLADKKKNLEDNKKQLTKLKSQIATYQDESDVLPLAEIEKIKKYFLIHLEEPKTKEELFQLASQINLSEQKFNMIFDLLCQEYNLNSGIINFPNYYQIMPITATTGQNFYYPTVENEVNMLMIGDLHIRNTSQYFQSLMYALNTYAIKHNISLACILGDIYDIRWEDMEKSKYEFMKRWEKIAFGLKKELDKSSFNYLILGGNHDERALKIGIDLIDFLEKNCEGVKSLGYSSASLVFGELKRNENNIGLHHTGRKVVLPKPVYIGEYENNIIKKYLNEYYNNSMQSYFDFFGHFHYDYLNLNDGYQLIPNFINDAYKVKAYHVKFHINEKRNIDMVTLKPLEIYGDSLVPNREIVYKKLKKY